MDIYAAGEISRIFKDLVRNDPVLGVHYYHQPCIGVDPGLDEQALAMDRVVNDMVALMFSDIGSNCQGIKPTLNLIDLKKQQYIAKLTPSDVKRCEECMDTALLRANVRKSVRDLVRMSIESIEKTIMDDDEISLIDKKSGLSNLVNYIQNTDQALLDKPTLLAMIGMI